jgi:hypothetical protein
MTRKHTQNWCWTNWKQCGFLLLFIPIGHLIQGSFFKNFQLTCGWCSLMCGPCPSMWKLILKYELLKMNWYLIMN